MKRNNLKKFIFLCTLTFVLTSCKNDTMDKIRDVKNQVSNVADVAGNISEMEENVNEMEARIEELKSMKPFTNEKFKTWMPEKIEEFKRTKFEFLNVMGAQGNMEFNDENQSKTVEIDIIDGAGEQGAMFFASQGMLTGLYNSYESEDDYKKEEIVERNGVKSMETYYKQDHKAEIKTTIDNRYMVIAKATQMTTDELFEFIQKLKITQLN